MRTTLFLRCLLLTSNQFVAVALRTGKYCFAGCDLGINYVRFNDTGAASGKTASCQSQLRAASLYLCIDEYCGDGGKEEWLRGTNETCRRLANTSMPPYSIVTEYGPDARAALRRLDADEAMVQPLLGEVVLLDEPFFERAFSTLDAAFYEYDIHLVYGWAMLCFWAVVLSIGVGSRVVSLIYNVRQRDYNQVTAAPDGPVPRRRSLFGIIPIVPALWKQYIASPATFNNRCSEPMGWCTIPPRIQSLTIFSFVVLNIVLCTADYRITHGNLYWPQESMQLWRYVSDRTGIISLANFPIIWIFGMRNNVLIWATGWGFGTYNSFHRWVARVSTVQAVVHSVGYTVAICEKGGWTGLRKYLGKHYFWNGELATVFMCALLAFSVYGLRRSHYEVFLIIHIAFSIAVLLTMFYHVEIFTAGEWTQFLYPCLAVWILDRISRVVRILAFNPRFWNTKAMVTYDASSNLVRMEVTYQKSLAPKPGTYYYVHVLDDLLYAHQSHPFTLAYVRTDDVYREEHIQPLLQRPSTRRTSSVDSTDSDPLLASTTASSVSSSLVFLIRPYGGFTSRLAQKASASAESLRILVEGPYGHTAPLRQYSHVLFVVGGTGIAVPLSHFASILTGGSAVTSLRIVWAVREHAFLASVLNEFRSLLQDERVCLEAYVTQNEENLDDVATEELKRVKIEAGRPEVQAVVADAAAEAHVQYGRLAIMACGPAQMADQARQASVAVLGQGIRGVDYFEESFKW